MDDWKKQVKQAEREAKADIVGIADIKNEAQAKVALALIEIYGDHDKALIYFEPLNVKSSQYPPDAVVVHPDIGLVVFEVKGYFEYQIQRVNAGTFYVSRGRINPVNQAKEAMFDIKNAIERQLQGSHNSPLTNCMAVFPNLPSGRWHEREFHKFVDNADYLLKEHVENPQLLKEHVAAKVKRSLEASRKPRPIDEGQLLVVRKAFGDSSTINDKRELRQNIAEDSLGAMFDDESNLDKQISEHQQELSRLEIAGAPRLIRGVAGSGKTVILANVASRYLKRSLVSDSQEGLFESTDDSAPRVAVVCYNQALISLLRRKISAAFREQTGQDLPENLIEITHMNGLYYLLSREGRWKYLRMSEAKKMDNPVTHYLEEWDASADNKPMFDAIFVDEGQDIDGDEYRLLYKLIKPNPKKEEDKNLIVFYDDAQNIYARRIPTWKDFGINVVGRSQVMETCFRNTKEIVELAFNVLVGTQLPTNRQTGTRLFVDLADLRKRGLVAEHSTHIEVNFAERRFEPPVVKGFFSEGDEEDWLVEQIRELIVDENVRPEDILVLIHKGHVFQNLREKLRAQIASNYLEGFILPHTRNPDEKSQHIFQENHLTISTPHSAKGYDAHVVLFGGLHTLNALSKEDRAVFYVGATRAKNLLYLSGTSTPEQPNLLDEALAFVRVTSGDAAA